MKAIKNYFKSSFQEFNNVTWPTRNQSIRISTIVLIFMIISSILLGLTDHILSLGYQALLSLNF